MKKILISLTIFIGTVLVAGAVMELVKTDKQEHARYFRTRNVFQYLPGYARFDGLLGYTLTPNLDVAFDNQEFHTTVRTNAMGLRDDHASLQNPDMILLGDSYVWGWGVDEQQSVEKQLEQLTGKKILNAGVPGYGNLQELLLMMRLHNMGSLQGKHIILFFCANDLQDNQNTSFNVFPYLKEENGGLVFSRPSKTGFDEWMKATDKWTIHSKLAKHSILWYDVCAAISNTRVKDIYRDYQTAKAVNGGKAFLLVADRLATAQQLLSCRMSIVYVPPASYYQTGRADRSYMLVQSACHKLHIRFIDLSSILTQNDYYPFDLHWTAEGHKKAAHFIASQLK